MDCKGRLQIAFRHDAPDETAALVIAAGLALSVYFLYVGVAILTLRAFLHWGRGRRDTRYFETAADVDLRNQNSKIGEL
jgi:hypothetical protein